MPHLHAWCCMRKSVLGVSFAVCVDVSFMRPSVVCFMQKEGSVGLCCDFMRACVGGDVETQLTIIYVITLKTFG